MQVLVIGGSRFSGPEILTRLVEKGHDVIVANRGKSEKGKIAANIKDTKFNYPEGITKVTVDRQKKTELIKLLSKQSFEAIIDTCAYKVQDIQPILNNTPESLEHYVFTSTASVYDFDNIRFFPIKETAPIGPMSADSSDEYSRNKRRIEAALQKAYDENNFPFTMIRPTYIYGPNNPLYRETYFFDRFMDNKSLYIPGTGEFLVDFVYAKDVAWLLTEPLEQSQAIGEVFNAAGQGGITLNSYVELLAEITNNEIPIIHYDPNTLQKKELESAKKFETFPYQYDAHLVLSRTKTEKLLNYIPTPLKKGLSETFIWYTKNKEEKWQAKYSIDEKIADKIKNVRK
ncbi:MAG: NAD-dependent epimerase/dehydratase family protein [Asgard group archaeon]|nr:NAD-dependent epimerase/dehydratase family protein [Asgard group archaeon]